MKHFFLVAALLLCGLAASAQNTLTPKRDAEGKWGYMQFDQWVIQPRFEAAGTFGDGLAPVKLNGKYGYINRNGQNIIPYKYDFASMFCEGLARVRLNGKYGFVDTSGQQVIVFKYNDATDFKDGLASVSIGGKTGFIDKTEQWFTSRAEMMGSYSAFTRNYVETNINEWQQKGKYEKVSQWEARVNESSRRARVDSLVVQARDEFIRKEGAKAKPAFILRDYDSENELFLLHDKRFGDILVPVPIDEAEAFETNFRSVTCQPVYDIDGDQLGLKRVIFKMPSGARYYYDNAASLQFAAVDIDYNFDKIDFSATPSTNRPNNQTFTTQTVGTGGNTTPAAPRNSDVDRSIPKGKNVNENTFAVIIANENYRNVTNVTYALNDGRTFSEYCQKTLGIPEKNIHAVYDATLGSIIDQVDWITGITRAYNGDAKVIFYYAGHGIPEESTRDAYLLPVDGNGTNTRVCYKLSELYEKLNEYPTRSTVVFLDACFSGAERSGNMLASARGVALKAKNEKPSGNMVVFSAAQGDETAYPYKDKSHGLFTYFLLKKLQETQGDVSLGDLADYVTDQVGKRSIVENSKSQTPTVTPSGSMDNNWKKLKLNK